MTGGKWKEYKVRTTQHSMHTGLGEWDIETWNSVEDVRVAIANENMAMITLGADPEPFDITCVETVIKTDDEGNFLEKTVTERLVERFTGVR